MSYFFWTFLLPTALIYLIIQQHSSSRKSRRQLSELQEQLKRLQQLLEQSNRHSPHHQRTDDKTIAADAPSGAADATDSVHSDPAVHDAMTVTAAAAVTAAREPVQPSQQAHNADTGSTPAAVATEHAATQAEAVVDTADMRVDVYTDTDTDTDTDIIADAGADAGDAAAVTASASAPLTEKAATATATATERSETLLPLTDSTNNSADETATTTFTPATWELPETSLTTTEDGAYISETADAAETAETENNETARTEITGAASADSTDIDAIGSGAAVTELPRDNTTATQADATGTDRDRGTAADTATAGAEANAATAATVATGGTPETGTTLASDTSVVQSIVQWFSGGNLIARAGVLFLLLGVVFLLRLANEYFAIPLTVKLLLIASGGCITTFIGLKISRRRPGYGLTLQGAGFATVYFTLFAAYRLYSLLPAGITFALLAVFAAANAFSAVRQNALPLALLAFGGAFLAPVLTATSAGNVVHLFTYYLVLNIAVAWMAHHRTWKILNLLSASVTLGLGFLWGVQNAAGDTLASVRWQLVTLVALHMLLYLFISLRYSQQLVGSQLSDTSAADAAPSESRTPAVDMGLLFGVAIMGFGLLAGLLHDIPYALAAVSGILAAVYGVMWWYIRRHRLQLAALQNGLLALSTGFATLTIPLALNAQWTSIGWSVQAAALIWTAKQQRKAVSMLVGLVLLTVSAAMALQTQANRFTYELISHETLPLISSSLAAMFCAFTLRYLHTQRTGSHASAPCFWENTAFSWTLLTAASLLWLLTTGSIAEQYWHIDLAAPYCFALSATVLHALWYVLDRKYCWVEAHNLSRLTMPLLYLLNLIGWHTSLQYRADTLLAQESLIWLWALNLLAGTVILGIFWLRHRTRTIQHTRLDQLCWLAAILWLAAETIDHVIADGYGIAALFTATALCLLPLYRHRHAASRIQHATGSATSATANITDRRWLNAISLPQAALDAGCILAILSGAWFVWVNAVHSGTFASLGLPYIPLLNPLDITLIAILALWYALYHFDAAAARAHHSHAAAYRLPFHSAPLVPLFLLALFWMANSVLIRLLHATAYTPLWTGSPWYSSTVQTGFTIFWSLLALVLTITGNRLGSRRWWWLGKALLVVVVLKLLLIDLSSSTTILRVVSFMGAGILMMVIGYFAPLPPRAGTETGGNNANNDNIDNIDNIDNNT